MCENLEIFGIKDVKFTKIMFQRASKISRGDTSGNVRQAVEKCEKIEKHGRFQNLPQSTAEKVINQTITITKI